MLIDCVNKEERWPEVRDRLKAMVLNALTSDNSKRGYGEALDQFFTWLKENNGKLDRESVLAFRTSLIAKELAPTTVNQRLAAVRAFAREAEADAQITSDCGRHIEQVKGIPVRARKNGNWMTHDQVTDCFQEVETDTLKGKRDLVVLALLFGCGLRRSELADLGVEDFEKRGRRWCIPNLRGKGKRPRTVIIPDKYMKAVRDWMAAAEISESRTGDSLSGNPHGPKHEDQLPGKGKLIRAINKADRMWGDGVDPATIREIVAAYAGKIGIESFAPHDARRTYARLLRKQGRKIEEIQRALGHSSPMTTHRYIGDDDEDEESMNDGLDLF